MGRRPVHVPLRVFLNDRRVGTLSRDASGAVGFAYDAGWLDWPSALPVSLSLPLRESAYRGRPVSAVFENLLPDSATLRRRIAAAVGALGVDAHSLLSVIGRDCVGALQFVPDGAERSPSTSGINGEPLGDVDVETILKGLGQTPLGLAPDDAFRISLSGAQDKTALLRHDGRWLKPHGATPTTHIFKPQIGQLPDGIDLSDSIENEFYCLKLTEAFGLPVNEAHIETFGEMKALVVERFDRRWTRDGRLLRLPQEDCCQALSVSPADKYETDGGPGMVDILRLLSGGDTPSEDQDLFFKAQLIFWLIGATDGHAKNFSVFIGPGGSYRLTPLYDILTAQPSLVLRQLERKRMRLAMAVGDRRHYRVDQITGRHFIQSAMKAGLSKTRVSELIGEVAARAGSALDTVAVSMPPGFPALIHESVRCAVLDRAKNLARNAE